MTNDKEELEHYRKLKSEGRLLELPFVPGALVWEIVKASCGAYGLNGIRFGNCPYIGMNGECMRPGFECPDVIIRVSATFDN